MIDKNWIEEMFEANMSMDTKNKVAMPCATYTQAH
jgi:hypothetical protein